MAHQGSLKSEIREKITKEYYPIDFTIDEIRFSYQFNETCQKTVPQAMACFFEWRPCLIWTGTFEPYMMSGLKHLKHCLFCLRIGMMVEPHSVPSGSGGGGGGS